MINGIPYLDGAVGILHFGQRRARAGSSVGFADADAGDRIFAGRSTPLQRGSEGRAGQRLRPRGAVASDNESVRDWEIRLVKEVTGMRELFDEK